MPMKNSTLDALAHFSRNEKELFSGLKSYAEAGLQSPGKQTVRNILDYSKSLSVRKSKHLDHFFMTLN
jgi:hypothetical protein